jgi:tetratricopeptide (TPR) repeat protein
VDLGQRTKELAGYYKRELRPNGIRPICLYENSDDETDARGVNCFGSDKEQDAPLVALPERSGTVFMTPHHLFRNSYWDLAALRESTPIKRFGNLLIYRGTFYLPGQAASALYWRGSDKIYGEKPDQAEAEKAFLRSVELDPSAFFVHIQLGNLYLRRGSREESLRAYSEALKYAPEELELRSVLQNQIQRVSREALSGISPLRDPFME